MSSFTDLPAMRPLDNGREWELLGEFEYHIGEYPSAYTIVVPVGFVTDFASIPRILWNILPPTGRWSKSAVVHDYLYERGGKYLYALDIFGDPCYRIYNKKQVDDMFKEAMGVLGVSWITRHLMWCGVRIGGRGNFGKV